MPFKKEECMRQQKLEELVLCIDEQLPEQLLLVLPQLISHKYK